MRITFDQKAIGVVLDGVTRKSLGTCFSFIRSDWAVTARHVIVKEGQVRSGILVWPHAGEPTQCEVAFLHPVLDLAVLKLATPMCNIPLYPAHQRHASTDGLLHFGYSPSLSTSGRILALSAVAIPAFEIEVRERTDSNEELIVFESEFSEGGHSGGPIIGDGAGVVGVIIESFWRGDQLAVRGTSVLPLVDELEFGGTSK